jgi:hypothetical protein
MGVFEALKVISKKTLAAVHRKISGEPELERTLPAISVPATSTKESSKTEVAAKTDPADKVVATKKPREKASSDTSDVLFQALEGNL